MYDIQHFYMKKVSAVLDENKDKLPVPGDNKGEDDAILNSPEGGDKHTGTNFELSSESDKKLGDFAKQPEKVQHPLGYKRYMDAKASTKNAQAAANVAARSFDRNGITFNNFLNPLRAVGNTTAAVNHYLFGLKAPEHLQSFVDPYLAKYLNEDSNVSRAREREEKARDLYAEAGATSNDYVRNKYKLDKNGYPAGKKSQGVGSWIMDNPVKSALGAYLLYKMFGSGGGYQMGPMPGYQMGGPQPNIAQRHPYLTTAAITGAGLYGASNGWFGKGLQDTLNNWWNGKSTDAQTKKTNPAEDAVEQADKQRDKSLEDVEKMGDKK